MQCSCDATLDHRGVCSAIRLSGPWFNQATKGIDRFRIISDIGRLGMEKVVRAF
jgi:hypothetical protein